MNFMIEGYEKNLDVLNLMVTSQKCEVSYNYLKSSMDNLNYNTTKQKINKENGPRGNLNINMGNFEKEEKKRIFLEKDREILSVNNESVFNYKKNKIDK